MARMVVMAASHLSSWLQRPTCCRKGRATCTVAGGRAGHAHVAHGCATPRPPVSRCQRARRFGRGVVAITFCIMSVSCIVGGPVQLTADERGVLCDSASPLLRQIKPADAPARLHHIKLPALILSP